ncbi:MAG: DUF1264 domain-containing protein, partial [Candidatus Eremiobacteraeota bacterium]|nr:DUF1264 domain-containing protein [Candidatus Eremiobacteraeota bacterium]
MALVSVALAVGWFHRNGSATAADMGGPTAGYSLHIDADKHFGDAQPGEIAHHWCKNICASLTKCELFDSDAPNARLVGVETIVPTTVWKTFPEKEQALWHYRKVELKKIHATLPDTPKEQQAKIIAALTETYGKVYILWDSDVVTGSYGPALHHRAAIASRQRRAGPVSRRPSF